MTKDEARKRVAELVEKYEQIKKSGQIKKYSEEDTKKGFIVPLFQALDWNFEDRDEVSSEEHVKSSGFIDYGFYINDAPKFYLEAKKLSADIHNEEYAKQAIRYAWNRGVTWAVLTDFESLIVFYAQSVSQHLGDKRYFEITYDQYLERFDELWRLSKEAFRDSVLDQEAEKGGKKYQKTPVTDTLYKDLNESRELLNKSFSTWNEDKIISNDLLEEGIQRFLDRLIFIRVAEDRGLENPTLLPMLRQHHGSSSADFFKDLVAKFRELDDIYNSNLFAKHPFEQWDEYDGKTGEVIEKLYGNPGYYEYDFKAIPADILGSVYENYLGYKLSQSDKGVAVAKDARKRKEQGIYYTPTYIVDYIVTNALVPVLDRCESVEDVQKIKVLDPACGSGSFLIRAMEMIFDWFKKYNPNANEMTKISILQNNIFGVDLDEQAVEIARLNLLINSLDSRMKLPDLSDNIKNGNSLISGSDAELGKYFGKDFRDKRSFNWQEKFPQVFNRENSGFDVIIGNPPYVRVDELNVEDKNFWKNRFTSTSGKYDLYYLFIERSINLLRSGGQLGFIVPNKFCVADSAEKLRSLILAAGSSSFLSVSKIPVFKDAANYPVILILQNNEEHDIKLSLAHSEEDVLANKVEGFLLSKEDIALLPQGLIPVNASKDELALVMRLLDKSDAVKDNLKISEGLRIPASAEAIGGDLPIIKQFQFERNSSIKPGGFVSKDNLEKVSGKTSDRYLNIFKPKIVIAEDALRISATIDNDHHVPQGGVYFGVAKKAISLEALLAILNSQLLSFVYDTLFSGMHMGGGYMRYRTKFLESLPLIELSSSQANELKTLEDKILNTTSLLSKSKENSNEWISIKTEVEKTDHQIDQLVYKLYGLNDEEIKIIESQAKA